VLRLKRPADECGKPAALILLLANAMQMLYPVLGGLDVTEHHGRA
jgi:hypothetical protein